jgi:hypothetical protein
MAEEETATWGKGTSALKIADDCFSHVGWRRHLSPVAAFAA